MSTRREMLASLTAIPLAGIASAAEVTEDPRQDRDKELFLEAAVELANGRYIRARLLLHTIASVYDTSPLIPQVRLLLFFSHIAETPRLNGGARLINEIEDYLRVVEGTTAE